MIDLKKLKVFEAVKANKCASLYEVAKVIEEFTAVYNCESDGYDGDLIQRQSDALDARRYMLETIKQWGGANAE